MNRSNLIQSNALSIPLASGTVQTCVTSPPYYGLRDYGVGDQLGLEPTLQGYIDNMVAVFDEVWRVLRDDGTVWLNIGDSYATHQKGNSGHGSSTIAGKGNSETSAFREGLRRRIPMGLKPKDLMLVPHRLAIALQERGWWVRSDIVWHKPNPMPESVTDRPTKAHEYIFLLSKSARYYYDADAVREGKAPATTGDPRINDNGHRRERGYPGANSNGGTNLGGPTGGRNKRSVWTITTKPYPGSHFATFPPELPEMCIKAGTSEKGQCPECGAPWERVVQKDRKARNELDPSDPRYRPNTYHGAYENINGKGDAGYTETKTLYWKPSCYCWKRKDWYWCPQCENKYHIDDLKSGCKNCGGVLVKQPYEPVPQIVLDPFNGSGTTVMVAQALGRVGIGLDLSWGYLQLARERCGLAQMDEWMNGKKVEAANLEGLPMFANG